MDAQLERFVQKLVSRGEGNPLFILGQLAFSAVLVGWESIQRLFEPAEVTNLGLLAAAAAFTAWAAFGPEPRYALGLLSAVAVNAVSSADTAL